jgi:hypothetical protein
MHLRPLLAAALLAAAAAPAPRAAAAGTATACRGTLAGAVKGTFGCLARVLRRDDGKLVFVLTPKDRIDEVPTYQPGSFELPDVPAPRTYTLDALGMGMASVAAEGGVLYTATRTSSQRGEVTLTFTTVTRGQAAGAWDVHGSYRARLLPAGAGKPGEVIVEARF